MTMYSPTKFAVVGFTQQLRWEIAADGAGVTLVLPGLVKSGIFGAPGSGLAAADVSKVLRTARSPDELARKVREGVQRDRAVVRSGIEPALFGLVRLLPGFVLDPLGQRVAQSTLRMLRKGLQPSEKSVAAGHGTPHGRE